MSDIALNSVSSRKIPWVKVVVAAVALAAIVVAFRMLPIAQWLTSFQAYVRGAGPIGYVIYAAVYALCVALAIPGAAILSAGAGAIFGLVGGTIVVVIGATIGATAAFILARTLLRKKVERMAAGNAKVGALDRAIEREGAKIVLLVRLAPVFPFTYVNYIFGLTGIRLLPYVLATLIGIIPGTIAFTYLGYAAAGVASGKRAIQIAGAILALIASIFVARVATRAIKRAGVDEG